MKMHEKEELAELLVDLIRDNPEVRDALVDWAFQSPYLKTEL